MKYKKDKFKHNNYRSPSPNETFIDDATYNTNMRDIGQGGWELICVQPVLKPVLYYSLSDLSCTIADGYLFFWKRAIE